MEPTDQTRRWPLVVGRLLFICLILSLGLIVFMGPSDSPNEAKPQRAATSAGSSRPIPVACQELLDGQVTPVPLPEGPVLTNGNVITMDPQGSRSETVAVAEGRIMSIDSTGVSAQANVIDLDGATVVPGFIDSHSHWIGDRDQVGNTVQEAINTALSHGWTSISELFVSADRLGELCGLEKDGELKLKVGAFLPLNYQMQRFGHWYDSYRPGEAFSPHLFVQGLKFFADGAPDGLGFQTKPRNETVQGQLFWSPEELAAEFQRASDAGWQIAIHATGDGGLDLALDAFEAIGYGAVVDSRDRIEHLTTVRDDQLDRIEDLGLIGSIQLSFFHGEATENLLRWLGRDRVGLSGRWRDLIDAGIPIAGGSDHPWALAGESGSSIAAISQAVTRVGAHGEKPPSWMLSQSMTVEEALRSLTIDAAFAQGTEDLVGSIEKGKAADLVILSDDPTAVAPENLVDIDVVATFVDGRIEFCGESVPADLEALCPSAEG